MQANHLHYTATDFDSATARVQSHVLKQRVVSLVGIVEFMHSLTVHYRIYTLPLQMTLMVHCRIYTQP